eukprot:757755-Hanusia_phi.AAC.1
MLSPGAALSPPPSTVLRPPSTVLDHAAVRGSEVSTVPSDVVPAVTVRYGRTVPRYRVRYSVAAQTVGTGRRLTHYRQ